MHTARLQTVYASAATTRCHSWGSQVNKFEQVSSVGHKMSTAGGLYSEGQGIMGLNFLISLSLWTCYEIWTIKISICGVEDNYSY